MRTYVASTCVALATCVALVSPTHAQTCQVVGTFTYCSNGLTSNQVGTFTYYNDGTTRQQIGNFDVYTRVPTPTYLPPPPPPVYVPQPLYTPGRRY